MTWHQADEWFLQYEWSQYRKARAEGITVLAEPPKSLRHPDAAARVRAAKIEADYYRALSRGYALKGTL